MKELILVGGGSFIGGISRYCLSGILLHQYPEQRFPLGTFAVNFLGCLLIGIFAALAEHHHFVSQNMRLFLITGLLGGFTTFSAFGFETIFLLRTNHLDLALLNVCLSVTVCLAAVWLGLRLVEGL